MVKKKTMYDHPGRPLSFKSVKELDEKIDEYFAYCDNGFRNLFDEKTGETKQIAWSKPYTMSGLAVWLGTDRKTLYNYSKRDEYFPSIKKALARVEADLEERAITARQPAGTIFVLKNNFTWVDETRQKLDANVQTNNELSPEAQAVLAKASRATNGAAESE